MTTRNPIPLSLDTLHNGLFYRTLSNTYEYLWNKVSYFLLLPKRQTMVKEIDKNEVNRVNKIVCDYFKINIEDLYKEGKKNKVCTNAFCHILHYLHCVDKMSIEQLAREYRRKRRILLSHIAKHKDFIRIYNTTRKESEDIYRLLKEKN